MKRTSLLGLACTLLLAACQLPFGGVSQPPDVLPGQWGGIVPSPKGPRPLENIALPPLGSWLGSGIAKQGSDLTFGVPQRIGVSESASPVAAPHAPDPRGANATGAPYAGGAMPPGAGTPDQADPMATLPLSAETPLQGYADLTSSLGPELVAYALDNGYLPAPAWAARPWEFWAAAQQPPASWVQVGDYQLGLGLWTHPDTGSGQQLELGLQLRAPQLSLAERPPLNLTLLIDSSTALKATLPQVSVTAPPTVLTALQATLQALPSALKPGDRLSIISLDGRVLLDQWPVGADFAPLRQVTAEWASDRVPQLAQSLEQAYQRARSPEGTHNALVLLSSAEALGDGPAAHEQLLQGQAQGVAFAAVELGQLAMEPQRLAQLAAGVGAPYTSVQTLQDARRTLGQNLIALLNLAPAALQLEVLLPPGLEPLASGPPAANTGVPLNHLALNRQLSVLQRYRAATALSPSAMLKVRVQSQNLHTGAQQTAEYAQPLASLLRQSQAGQTAASLTLLADAVSGALPLETVKAAWENRPPALTEADQDAQRRLGIWLKLQE